MAHDNGALRIVKAFGRDAIYRSGIARLRVMSLPPPALTVLMFHRVLSAGHPHARAVLHDGALSEAVFSRALDVLTRLYDVVSLDDVRDHLDGRRPLGARAALVTFDDGWIDTLLTAAPELARRGVPAVVFVPPAVFETDGPFWQERLAIALRSGRLAPARAIALAVAAGAIPAQAPRHPEALLRWLTTVLTDTPPALRDAILRAEPEALKGDGTRHFIRPGEVAALRACGIAFGAHGLTHDALTVAPDPAFELAESRRRLSAIIGGDIVSMSFPHGRFSADLVALAYAAGYRLLFTSRSVINRMPALGSGRAVLGRIAIGTAGRGSAGTIAHDLVDRAVAQARA